MARDLKKKIENYFKQPLWLLILTVIVMIIVYYLRQR